MENIIHGLLAEYADVIKEFAFPFIIGIFALSFPLLQQTTGRIDDKYGSTLFIKVFRKDRITKGFLWALIFSLISCLCWVFRQPRCIDFESKINIIIDNSALIFLSVATVFLLAYSIGIAWLTYVYYLPARLLKRLKRQYNHAISKKNKSMYFIAISKIMQYAIKKSDKDLSLRAYEFFVKEFVNYRAQEIKKINNKLFKKKLKSYLLDSYKQFFKFIFYDFPKGFICNIKKLKKDTKDIYPVNIKYPNEFYTIINETNEKVFMNPTPVTSFFDQSEMLALLIDEYQHTTISEESYQLIWRSLRQSLTYSKDGFIMSYWKRAHQYYSLFLNKITPEFDKYFNITNNDKIQRRNFERFRFLELHYALGGLLVMKGRFSLLNQLVLWTNQEPPKYVLVPETMHEVIERFMRIEKGYDYYSICYYQQHYPFPDVDGVNAEDVIKLWIKKYCALLFLRQYTLTEHYTYSNTLSMPFPPQSLKEKRKWNEELDVLKTYVNEYLSNSEILEALNMKQLAKKEWFERNNKPIPSTLIDNLKCKIDEDIHKTKCEQTIDEGKKEKSKKNSLLIIQNTFKEVTNLFSENVNPNSESLHFNGRYEVLDKAAFARESEVSYIGTDTIVAQCLSDEFKINSMNIFFKMQQNIYSLDEKDLFNALDNIKLSSPSDYVILNIGLYLEYYKNFHKVDKLKYSNNEWKYNGIDIVEAPYNPYLAQSFILIKKSDLPTIKHNQISDEIKKKYNLEEIDNIHHIYFNIIDLNENLTTKDEVQKKTNIQDLETKVLYCIDLDTKICYDSQAKFIRFNVFSRFDNQGNPNKIEDVKNVW